MSSQAQEGQGVVVQKASSSLKASNHSKFAELVECDADEQMQVFLKSFIFALGDEWKTVGTLCSAFKQYVLDTANRCDVNVVQAADFLQVCFAGNWNDGSGDGSQSIETVVIDLHLEMVMYRSKTKPERHLNEAKSWKTLILTTTGVMTPPIRIILH